MAISSGISFAALTSQDKLTGSTIQTATANLLLSLDGTNYANTQTGFSFSGIVPGGQAVPANGYDFYVKNSGTTPLALKISVSNNVNNPDNVDLTKVHVILAHIGGSSVQNFTLQSLIDSYDTGGQDVISPTQLPSGGVMVVYRLSVSMDADAISGGSATISNIDFNFNGVVVNL